MNPYPLHNSVLIMDNASTHHFEGLQKMVEVQYTRFQTFACNFLSCISSGRWLMYLPAYSFDFNPLEEGFSAMKAQIQHNCKYVLTEMKGRDEACDAFGVLWQAVFEMMVPKSIVG